MKYEHSEGGQAELRVFLALVSRRFHGQDSDHECENSGHGLLKAVIEPEIFDAATVRPSRTVAEMRYDGDHCQKSGHGNALNP